MYRYFLLHIYVYIYDTITDSEWVPENLDDGHLDYYFFLLAGKILLILDIDELVATFHIYNMSGILF